MGNTEVIDAGKEAGRSPEIDAKKSASMPPQQSRGTASKPIEMLKSVISFPAMLGLALVGVFTGILRGFMVDPDMWWHLRTGELILRNHSWATSDPYSYTAFGFPWMSCEWLGDVFFALVYRYSGLGGLQALQMLLAGAIMLALYGLATLRARNSKAGFAACAAMLGLTSIQFNLRPQMLGYLFLVVTMIVLELYRQGKTKAIWFLPLLFLAWINAHGSWIVGIGVVAVFIGCGFFSFRIGSVEAHAWSSAQRKSLGIVFMLCLAVIPITPYGTRLAMYPFMVASSLPVSVANVMEWFPISFGMLFGRIFLALVLGFFVVQMLTHRVWQFAEIFLFVLGTAMACLHVRFLLLFVPFFAPLLATVIGQWIAPYERAKDKYVINAVLMAGILLAVAHYFPSKAEVEKNVANQFPVEALAYMKQHPLPGPLFNTYGFGGYIINAGYRTFIDGRSELFEHTGVLADYMHVVRLLPGGLQVLDAYQIRTCLVGPDEPLAVVLEALPDWQRVYRDQTSVIYVRKNAPELVVSDKEAFANALLPQFRNGWEKQGK